MNVHQKATILFPRGLDLKESEVLLSYIALNMPADISYKVSQHKDLITQSVSELGQLKNISGSFELGGTIKSGAIIGSFDSFNVKSEYRNSNANVYSLDFWPIPGYSLQEHRKEVRDLWDDTRKVIKRHFIENSKHVF